MIKKEQLTKLESEAAQLKDPVQIDVIEKRKVAVQERINALEEPIQERRYAVSKTDSSVNAASLYIIDFLLSILI